MKQSIFFAILALGGLFMAYGAYCPTTVTTGGPQACGTAGSATLPFTATATATAATFYATVTVNTACAGTVTNGLALADIKNIFGVTISDTTDKPVLSTTIGSTKITVTGNAGTPTTPFSVVAGSAVADKDVYTIVASIDLKNDKLVTAIGGTGVTAATGGPTSVYTATWVFNAATKIHVCTDAVPGAKWGGCTLALRIHSGTAPTTLDLGLLTAWDSKTNLQGQYLFKERTGTSTSVALGSLKAATLGDAKTDANLPKWSTTVAGLEFTAATQYLVVPVDTSAFGKDTVTNVVSFQLAFWINPAALTADAVIFLITDSTGNTERAKITMDATGKLTATLVTLTATTTGTLTKGSWSLVSAYFSTKGIVINIGTSLTTAATLPSTAAVTTGFASTDIVTFGAKAKAFTGSIQDVKLFTPGSLIFNSVACSNTDASPCLTATGLHDTATCLATSVCPPQTTGTKAESCVFTPSSFINTDLSVLQIIAISLAGVGLAGLIA